MKIFEKSLVLASKKRHFKHFFNASPGFLDIKLLHVEIMSASFVSFIKFCQSKTVRFPFSLVTVTY